MNKKIIFILAEGEHDSAFLYRILKADGFKSHNVKIKDYPEPLKKFLEKDKDIIQSSILEVNIQQASRRFMPYYVMQKDYNLIFIYSIGGNTNNEPRRGLVSALNALNTNNEGEIQTWPKTSISVLYFFDADDKGTDSCIAKIIEEINPVFPKWNFKEKSHYKASTFYKIENLKVGAYIFREATKDKGMLEDVILPLMRKGNDDIFEAAETFLSTNTTCTLFKDKLEYDKTGTILKKVNKQKYSHRKSLIGTVGQLQKSGKSNTVCISDTDYLTDDKILNNDTCKEIIALLKQVV